MTPASLEDLKVRAQRYSELLRECQVEFRAYGATGLVETIEAVLAEALPKSGHAVRMPSRKNSDDCEAGSPDRA